MKSTSPTRARGWLKGRGLRTKGAWLVVAPFLLLARPSPGPLMGGMVLAALGLLLRGWSAGTIRKDVCLTTTGPYAFTRHPLYLGSFLIGLGLSSAGGHWLWPALFLCSFVAVYRRTVTDERERLTQLFGHRYVDYSLNVPAFLPRLRPYAGARRERSRGFRWSRYLRHREWEALLGAAAAFALLGLKASW